MQRDHVLRAPIHKLLGAVDKLHELLEGWGVVIIHFDVLHPGRCVNVEGGQKNEKAKNPAPL